MTKKQQAKQLASLGRNGDTMLVHMSKGEFDAINQGLGSLTGSGATVNPDTGLPEMFNWSSLLPAAVGIGATVLSGGTLSPLAAGMLSGATSAAVTGDWRKGLVSGVTGAAAAGLGSGMSEMMGGAASAGVDAGAQMGGVMADTATSSMAEQALATEALEGIGSAYATAPVDAAMSAAATDGLTAGMTDATMSQGLGSLGSGAAANVGNTGATFSEAFMGDNLYSRTIPGLMGTGYSAMINQPTPEFETQSSEEDEAPTSYKTMHREYNYADPSYTVTGGEPDMFEDPTYSTHYFAAGGLASLNGDQDMVSTKRARQLRARYRSKKAVIDDLNRPNSYAKELGVTGPDDPILSIAFGFTKKQGRKNKSLSPAFAGGGHVQGEGDGMSDSIMTSIDGVQPAALSSDEYVVPADAVSDIGNGSSQAGAQQLDNMVARIRKMRHGTTEQPPMVDPSEAMPV